MQLRRERGGIDGWFLTHVPPTDVGCCLVVTRRLVHEQRDVHLRITGTAHPRRSTGNDERRYVFVAYRVGEHFGVPRLSLVAGGSTTYAGENVGATNSGFVGLVFTLAPTSPTVLNEDIFRTEW